MSSLFRSCTSSSAAAVRDQAEHQQANDKKPSRNNHKHTPAPLSSSLSSQPQPGTGSSKFRWSFKRKKRKQHAGKSFGVPLKDLPCDDHHVPFCLKDMVAYIEDFGTHVEGTFRRAGSLRVVKQMKAEYDKNTFASIRTFLPNHSPTDVITAAQLVKEFLREIPGYLITNAVMCELHTIYSDAKVSRVLAAKGTTSSQPAVERHLFSELDFANFRKILNLLSPRKYSVLEFIVFFCVRYAKHAEQTKMTIENLATVLAPNIFEPSSVTLTDLTSSMKEAETTSVLTRFLIKYSQPLFKPAIKLATSEHVNVREESMLQDASFLDNSFLASASIKRESEEAARLFEASGNQDDAHHAARLDEDYESNSPKEEETGPGNMQASHPPRRVPPPRNSRQSNRGTNVGSSGNRDDDSDETTDDETRPSGEEDDQAGYIQVQPADADHASQAEEASTSAERMRPRKPRKPKRRSSSSAINTHQNTSCGDSNGSNANDQHRESMEPQTRHNRPANDSDDDDDDEFKSLSAHMAKFVLRQESSDDDTSSSEKQEGNQRKPGLPNNVGNATARSLIMDDDEDMEDEAEASSRNPNTRALITTGTNPHIKLSRTPTSPLNQQLQTLQRSADFSASNTPSRTPKSPIYGDASPVSSLRSMLRGGKDSVLSPASSSDDRRRASDCFSEYNDSAALKQAAVRKAKLKADRTVARILFGSGYASSVLRVICGTSTRIPVPGSQEKYEKANAERNRKKAVIKKGSKAVVASSLGESPPEGTKEVFANDDYTKRGSRKPSEPMESSAPAETTPVSASVKKEAVADTTEQQKKPFSTVQEPQLRTTTQTSRLDDIISAHKAVHLLSPTKVDLEGVLASPLDLGPTPSSETTISQENRNYIFLCCKTLSKIIRQFDQEYAESHGGKKATSSTRGPVKAEVACYKTMKKWLKAYDASRPVGKIHESGGLPESKEDRAPPEKSKAAVEEAGLPDATARRLNAKPGLLRHDSTLSTGSSVHLASSYGSEGITPTDPLTVSALPATGNKNASRLPGTSLSKQAAEDGDTDDYDDDGKRASSINGKPLDTERMESGSVSKAETATQEGLITKDDAAIKNGQVLKNADAKKRASEEVEEPDSADLIQQHKQWMREHKVKRSHPGGLDLLVSEKAVLKSSLARFDARFEAFHGRPITKEDKQSLRGLYTRYKELKQQIAVAKAAAPAQKARERVKESLKESETPEAVAEEKERAPLLPPSSELETSVAPLDTTSMTALSVSKMDITALPAESDPRHQDQEHSPANSDGSRNKKQFEGGHQQQSGTQHGQVQASDRRGSKSKTKSTMKAKGNLVGGNDGEARSGFEAQKQQKLGAKKKKKKAPPTIPPRPVPTGVPSTTVSAMNGSESDTNAHEGKEQLLAQYCELKGRKTAIQRDLFAFQQEFLERHGHTPKTKADRAPKKSQYIKYKALKKELVRFQEEHGHLLGDQMDTSR